MVTGEENLDEKTVYEIRKQKLAALRKQGFNFPNDFRPQHLAADLLTKYNQLSKEELNNENISVILAGRIVLRRIMGKASFFHLQDSSGRIQVYLRQNDLLDLYEQFKHWDLGDIVGVSGYLFKTNSGELTIHLEKMMLLTKSLRPLPDKFHGLADQELCYRQRYIDLITNDKSRKNFLLRTKIIQAIRNFMNERQFLEVETPMMHHIQGGAIARPFITYHNTLDQQMYLRIAPELYLKRLVVGGFTKVYEINRNFRNEGISARHNPEFTMIEFYQAYADYKDLMQFTQDLFRYLCNVLQITTIEYQGHQINLVEPFQVLTMKEAILQYCPAAKSNLDQIKDCQQLLDKLQISYKSDDSLSKLQLLLFEEKVEHLLIKPTFITEYPVVSSPLARKNDANPDIVDRFELFIAGRELANGFSELNDAEDQAARFQQQVLDKNSGDLEAMHFDQDYIDALECGLPPTAGEGIGIDRLIMLFTDAPSIRDVILFPQLRNKAD